MRLTTAVAVTVGSLGLSAAPGGAAGSPPAAARGAGEAPGAAGQWLGATYAGPAGTLRYRLYVPGGWAAGRVAGRAAPLVVMLHGCTQDPEDFARGTRMNAVAEADGFLVAYPEQTAAANPRKCWTWYDPAHQARDAGEPALVAGLTREVMAAYAVDPRRVYVAGVSAGGAMSQIVAAAYPDLYAAAASHSGIPAGAARGVADALGLMQHAGGDAAALGAAVRASMGARARSVPVLVLHGAADHVVHPDNGRTTADVWAAVAGAPAAETLDSGASGGLAWHRRRRALGADPDFVEEWRVEGLGHAWSGGSTEGTFADDRGPDASREVARFFRAHPMPATPGAAGDAGA